MQHIMDVIAFWITVIVAIPIFKNGFLQFTAWSRQRTIILTEKEILFTQRMHKNPRALAMFIAKYAFMIAALLSVNLMFSSIGTTELGQKIYVMGLFVTGGTAYAMAIFAVGTITRIEKYDDTISSLQRKLQKLRGDELQPRG